jgi:hypothetical protein
MLKGGLQRRAVAGVLVRDVLVRDVLVRDVLVRDVLVRDSYLAPRHGRNPFLRCVFSTNRSRAE